MSTLGIKDKDAADQYLGVMGTGTSPLPFYSIPADFYTEVVKGNVAGHSIIHKFGHNTATANGSWQGVLEVAAQFPFVTAASTVRVKAGGNAADIAAGAGAQAVTVEGLDDTGAFASESIELAGASASAVTTTLFWRVFRMYITPLRAGSYSSLLPTATITLENGTGGTDLITILAEEGQSEFCCYSIPLGKTGYLISLTLSSDSTKASNFRLFTRAALTDFTTPFAPKLQKGYYSGVVNTIVINHNAPRLTIPALTDIWIEAYGAGAISEVSAEMEILLVDD